MVQVPEFFCTENLQVHPYRAQPYLGIPPCPNVPTGQVQIESRVNSTAKHLLPTQDTNAQYNVRSTAMATTDSTTSYSMASPSSGEHTSLALMKSGVSSTYSNQKEQSTFVSTRAPHPSTLAYSLEKQRMHFQKYRNHEDNQFSNQGDSQPSQYRTSIVEGMEQQTGVIHGTIDEYGLMVYPYPAPIMLVEKLFLDFRGRVWIEDEKRATNWDLLGLPRPQYKTMRPYDWERRSMPLSSASTSANTKLDNSHARYNHVSTKKSDSMGAQNEMSSESGSRGAEAPSIERSPVATTTINTPSTYSEQSRLGPARSTAAAVGGMLTGTIRSLLGVGGNVQEQEQSLSPLLNLCPHKCSRHYFYGYCLHTMATASVASSKEGVLAGEGKSLMAVSTIMPSQIATPSRGGYIEVGAFGLKTHSPSARDVHDLCSENNLFKDVSDHVKDNQGFDFEESPANRHDGATRSANDSNSLTYSQNRPRPDQGNVTAQSFAHQKKCTDCHIVL